MDFCHVWPRHLVGYETEGFDQRSSRELTSNVTENRGLEHFTTGLPEVDSRMAEGLQPGASLVFTCRHNEIEAYRAAGVALPGVSLV